MRLSLKIREAKKQLVDSITSHEPLHFGNAEEYRDFIINQMIHIIHGNKSSETRLIIYYEYKKRFAEQIEEHFKYA
jgi:hypothetical protein